MKDTPAEEKANRQELRELAIYLEGMAKGQGGNIQPLGTVHLSNLWKAIRHLDKLVRWLFAGWPPFVLKF